MSIDEKLFDDSRTFADHGFLRTIGQMVMVGFRGATPKEIAPFLRQVADLNLGGVVLFDKDVPNGLTPRNILSLPQVAELADSLQNAAEEPLLIAADQEGGEIARLRPEHGAEAMPSHRELGALGSIETVFEISRKTSQDLKRAGINLNFAPCVDLDLYPENPIIGKRGRSFGKDPFLVSRLAEAFIRGHHENGVLCAVKHFPGHGSSRHDSHFGLTDVTPYWSPDELIPYRELTRLGIVDMVMTAHIYHREWDEERPASLAPEVIDGLLRRDLGFAGVIVTDDLQMAAVSRRYKLRETVAAAVRAGSDLLLFANNSLFDPDIAPKVFHTLVELVKSGEIAAERINQSLARIARLKKLLRERQVA